LKPIRKRLTYANVMSTIAVFLVLGGATALAAHQLGRGSVGARQLKKNSVTKTKIRKSAVTAAKIHKGAVGAAKLKGGAVTTAKIRNEAVTGAKVDEASLGTVPNSAGTDVVKTAKGTIAVEQQATVLERGPLKLIVKCEPFELTRISAHVFIESSAEGSVFASWQDGGKELGPSTPEGDREVTDVEGADSNGPFVYDSMIDGAVSASAADGSGFNARVGVASEKASGTCWYWMDATILG
jgi:hypothetical protein